MRVLFMSILSTGTRCSITLAVFTLFIAELKRNDHIQPKQRGKRVGGEKSDRKGEEREKSVR